jgi:hypothetical protein
MGVALLADCEVPVMKPDVIKLLLFHYGRTGIVSNEKAKELFVACHENGFEIPSWLMDNVSNILKKQVEDYKKNTKSSVSEGQLPKPEQWIIDLFTEAEYVDFMRQVDKLLKEGLSQEAAIEKICPGCSFTPRIKKYRKLKKIYGDSPPETIFDVLEENPV